MLHCLHFYNDFFYIIMIFILSFFWWNLNKICTFNNTASRVNFLLFFFSYNMVFHSILSIGLEFSSLIQIFLNH